jgi:hypothetical protein
MSSSFVRQLSPAVQSITAAIVDGNLGNTSDDAARTARHLAIMGASTVAEIIEFIPSDYRDVLADALHALAQLVIKLDNSSATLAKWKEHQRVHTFPPHLRSSAPKVQLTSAFADTPAGQSAKTALDLAHSNFQIASLDACVRAKSDEVAALTVETSPEHAWTSFRAIVAARAPSIVAAHKLPTFGLVEGVETIVGWEASPAVIATRDRVLEDCTAYAMRVRSITESSIAHKAIKIKKKKALADAARTAAGDVDVTMASSTASIQSMVDKAVTSALKKQAQAGPSKRKRDQQDGGNAGAGKKKKSNADLMAQAKVSLDSRPSSTSNGPFLGPLRSRDRQAAGQQAPVRPSSLQTPSLREFNSRGDQEETTRQGRERQKTKGKRSAQEKGLVGTLRGASTVSPACIGPSTSEGSSLIASAWAPSASSLQCNPNFYRTSFISEGDLWISNPSLIPDYLLDLPIPRACDVIIGKMSIEMISNLSYQQDVHRSPDVHLPRELAYQISVGAKYMFHEPSNVELIRNAWKDFNRRLRWRIQFLFDNSGEKPYDPDYDVRGKSTKQAPALPHYIELGLVKGRIFVNQAISKVPDAQTLRHPHKSLQPDVRSIREFLLQKEYVITGTDKNLGIAVSKRDWIIEKSRDILSDVNNYRCLEHNEAINILNEKCTEMESLAQLAYQHVDHLEGTVADFLRSKITLRGQSHHIPHFYGIPKIHKSPVKMRPIIPCHTAIQNPAAKYVSKKLKPLIQEAATVIHGTKDLAQKLSKLVINTTRKWYIVTGDVVAFYPNIPLNHCLDIVYNMYFEFYWNIRMHDDPLNTPKQELFRRCLEIGNTNLITQFENKIYLQLNGLAMGVADSPDLANLYGYHFEKRSNVLNHPDIFYYGRYIDDCLAIAYAESEQQAVDLLANLVKFDNCTITWDCSESHQPFLDMLLYKDEDNTLQHMPYRKNGNHQERIPWISAHPYDVKRGTFYGEMSRLATLSSKIEHYLAAMRGLVTLYIRRGYPDYEVHKWLRSNLSKRWNERLAVKTASESSDILVLKTQYNLAWNYFNAHQLGDTIFDYWREWLERADAGNFNQQFPAPDKGDLRTTPWETGVNVRGLWDLRQTNLFNSKVILSRKRTRNFLDLTNLWKKSVIENLEEQTLDDIVGTAARYAALKRPLIPDVNTAVVGPRLKRSRVDPSNDEENTVEHVAHRSSSPTPTAWTNAPMGSWGRGSRM